MVHARIFIILLNIKKFEAGAINTRPATVFTGFAGCRSTKMMRMERTTNSLNRNCEFLAIMDKLLHYDKK
jgi:hypothetical protein